MNAYEPIGYLASLLVLAAFCMRGMVALRVMAIASNLAFIAYGLLESIEPVLLLHAVLLPTSTDWHRRYATSTASGPRFQWREPHETKPMGYQGRPGPLQFPQAGPHRHQ